jgi:hypothetical protein
MASSNYSIMEFLNHFDTEAQESVAWLEATKRFKTDREREAFIAGLHAGGRLARQLITINGPFRFKGGKK